MTDHTEEVPQPAPPTKFEVKVIWKGRVPEVIKDIIGYNLEHELYFFHLATPGHPETPTFKTIWPKHPDIRSLEIKPVAW